MAHVGLYNNTVAYQTSLLPGSGYSSIFLDSLIWGCQWIRTQGSYGPTENATPVELTYSYATGTLNGYTLSNWSASEINAFERAMTLYENVCNVHFTEGVFTAHYPAQTNIVYYQVPESFLGHGVSGAFEVPDGTYTSNYGYFNYQDSTWSNLNSGSYGFITLIHELGHGLGLAHPHDGGTEASATTFPGVIEPTSTGLYQMNQGIWTTMSYNDGWDQRLSSTATYGWQGTPMALDIAALQIIYGANTSFRTGSDTYSLPSTNTRGTEWSCIWDAGGIDGISNAESVLDCTIDLRPATLTGPFAGGYISSNSSIVGGFTIANNVYIENGIGGNGNDFIIGNSIDNQLLGNSGNDTLYGGEGNDQLIGGIGNDVIVGEAGIDTISYSTDILNFNISYHTSTSTFEVQDTKGSEGVDSVTNIEHFTFSNETYASESLLIARDFISGDMNINKLSYDGSANEYTIYIKADGTARLADNVVYRNGLDVLESIERIHFSDINIATDIEIGEHAGSAYRLYRAALDRVPDINGLGGWIKFLDDGGSLQYAAYGFMSSPEFRMKYGADISHEQFITLLYENVLHRAPETGGVEGWINFIQAGAPREQVLVGFSESQENINQTAELIAHGIRYTEWL